MVTRSRQVLNVNVRASDAIKRGNPADVGFRQENPMTTNALEIPTKPYTGEKARLSRAMVQAGSTYRAVQAVSPGKLELTEIQRHSITE
jgi:hypothetical protein